MKRLALKALRPLDRLLRKRAAPGLRLLVLQYQTPLGSAVHSTPLFRALRTAAPECEIAAACSGITADVLRHNPHVDRLIETRHPLVNFAGAAHDALKLRPGNYSDAITDASNRRTKIALLGSLSGAERKVGFTLAPGLYDTALDYDAGISLIDNNLRVLPLLGLKATRTEPEVFFSAADRDKARSLIGRFGIPADAPIAAMITQASGGFPEKRLWRAERFAALADELAGNGFRIVFIGNASEAPAINAIRRTMKTDSISASGAFKIPELAAFLSQCALAVALDTGPMHIARAVRLPTVVIARPWQPPQEWLPIGVAHCAVLMREDVVARARSDPVFAATKYIDEIEVAGVKRAAEGLLQRFPPTRESREARVQAFLKPE